MTTKAKNIAYWSTTALVAFFIGSGGVSQVAQFVGGVRGVVPVLRYPMYFFAILGFWKVLGAIAILAPRFPRLKEWAYAGIFFDVTGAAASYVAVGIYGVYAFSHLRSSYYCRSYGGVVGVAAAESCHWHSFSSDEWGELTMKAKSVKKSAVKKSAGSESPSRLIDGRIKELGDWRGETLARLRALIKQAVPGVVEEWKWRGVPVWYHEGMICTGETYKAVVKVTFAKGAALKDPSKLFNSSLEGNVRRAIDFHEGEAIDDDAFKKLVRDAAVLNGS